MYNIFDTEEQLAVNKAIANEKLKNCNKSDILRRFNFVLAMNDDNEIFNLYDGLKNKFELMTDEEWENIKSVLPFAIPYS